MKGDEIVLRQGEGIRENDGRDKSNQDTCHNETPLYN
jgi:hypothetical protein